MHMHMHMQNNNIIIIIDLHFIHILYYSNCMFLLHYSVAS